MTLSMLRRFISVSEKTQLWLFFKCEIRPEVENVLELLDEPLGTRALHKLHFAKDIVSDHISKNSQAILVLEHFDII